MDIDEVCEAISTAMTAAELTVNGKRVVSTPFVPDAVEPPHFFTAEYIGNYDKTFANPLVELTLTCRLVLTRADDRAGQSQARQLASTGAGTIHEAFLSMRAATGALGGAVDDLHLTRVTGPRLFQVGQVEYYGLEFSVFVMG